MCYFKIADHTIALQFKGEITDNYLYDSYLPFKVEEVETLLFTAIISSEPIDFAECKEVGQFDCGGAINGVFRKKDGGYVYQIRDFNQALIAVLSTNADFSLASIQVMGDDQQKKGGLNNALMILFSFASSLYDTLLIHASVCMKSDKGYLFLGKSGTGKSTHSRQWLQAIADTELLNDDNPAVRIVDQKVVVYGTPWSGKTPCYKNQKAIVGAFVRIVQYPKNEIQKNSIVEGLSSILASCSTMIWDKVTYHSITKTIAKVLQYSPVYTLRCLPNKEAAVLCYQTIKLDGK